ncbi:hypothetical protein [Mycolicibacterium sp.]|uniref:DUF7159 family protein n=1 Tax=Mycolicibacterium sp. TaxID=2320850 RepID=UPI001A278780|nr:hypothetical protein [Mycolicibacterium sp.]MBJ7339178.1 hypothetical protein [Mycolicibacterium sp.]
MDAVLGLSMTPTSVGLVLVEGQDADGATMDRDSFAVTNDGLDTSEQAAAAVLRTEAMAATRGLRLHSIGVTWSEDADLQASMLMESLSESGFDNVVAIRLPEATEALARGISEVLGYATTAVCVIEPESVISLIVNTSDGAVQTAFNHAIDSDDALISWLSTVFTRADWAPEALVVVGSAGEMDPTLHRLEDALSVPVYAPEEAKLALARGAALASAQSTEMPLGLFDDSGFIVDARTDSGRHRSSDLVSSRTLSRVGPVAMLAVGVVTFVVSVSIAISLQLSPARTAQPSSPVPAAKVESPEPVRAIPPAMPPPVAIPSVVEAAPPPAPEALPPVSDEVPVAVVDTPAEAPQVDQAPAAEPQYPADAAPVDPGLAPPVDPALAPPMAGTPLPPNVAPPYVAPVPTKKPGILTRIKEKLTPGPG